MGGARTLAMEGQLVSSWIKGILPIQPNTTTTIRRLGILMRRSALRRSCPGLPQVGFQAILLPTAETRSAIDSKNGVPLRVATPRYLHLIIQLLLIDAMEAGVRLRQAIWARSAPAAVATPGRRLIRIFLGEAYRLFLRLQVRWPPPADRLFSILRRWLPERPGRYRPAEDLCGARCRSSPFIRPGRSCPLRMGVPTIARVRLTIAPETGGSRWRMPTDTARRFCANCRGTGNWQPRALLPRRRPQRLIRGARSLQALLVTKLGDPGAVS